MTRVGHDCIGAEAEWCKANLPLPDVQFFYDTGSSVIEWSAAERALFPPGILCSIDQGGPGSPVRGSRVLDVESGAWSVGNAIGEAHSDPAHPALYGSRSTLQACADAGYRGDFWLAWPDWNGAPLPVYPGIRIVAVQDAWHANYDHTTILATDWPFGVPVTPGGPGISVTVISRTAHMAFGSAPGADHYDIVYHSPAGGAGVTIANFPAPAGHVVTHTPVLTVPGSNGGSLQAIAIVNGTGHVIGAKPLP